MWYKGKEYYNVNKWVGIFNRDYQENYGKVNAHMLHQLFGHYKIPKLTNKKRYYNILSSQFS